ncbi:hypothetical protein [Nocardioides jensenii]|uniref:hypothetical protein n=1 Tax=Nocardioides jensenii TaxID=1843 RepID=UPI000A91744B|nr:hypothetical protein [Nocardioides jensenii]
MTPIREKIVNNAAPYLRPGEQVQGAFCGQSISGWWFLLTYLMIFWLRYRVVIVTDQRILVLNTGVWSATKPKGVVAELPRNIIIGPAAGLWWKCETLGEKLFVHKRFHKDVLAADTLLAQSGMAPVRIPLGGHQPQQGQQSQQQFAVPPQQYGGQQWQQQGQQSGQQYAAPGQSYGEQQWQQPAPQNQQYADPGQQPGGQQYADQQWQQPAPQQWQPPIEGQQWQPGQQPGQPAQHPGQPGQQAQPKPWQQVNFPDEENFTRVRPRPEPED